MYILITEKFTTGEKMCQFLIGKVYHIANSVKADVGMCQFLIGNIYQKEDIMNILTKDLFVSISYR